VPAELVHADLERDPRARRRLLEYERHAAAGQYLGCPPVGLQLERAVEQPRELVARELLAGEEVPRRV
jgi:hypothetical protein